MECNQRVVSFETKSNNKLKSNETKVKSEDNTNVNESYFDSNYLKTFSERQSQHREKSCHINKKILVFIEGSNAQKAVELKSTSDISHNSTEVLPTLKSKCEPNSDFTNKSADLLRKPTKEPLIIMKLFKCKECDMSFENESYFTAHINQFHSTAVFEPKVVNKTQIFINKDKKKMNLEFSKDKTNITSIYGNMNLDNEEQKSENQIFRCSFRYCFKVFKTKMRLISHLIEKHSWKGFKCTKCQFETYLYSKLTEHENTVHHSFSSNCNFKINDYKTYESDQSSHQRNDRNTKTQEIISNKSKTMSNKDKDIMNTKLKVRVRAESELPEVIVLNDREESFECQYPNCNFFYSDSNVLRNHIKESHLNIKPLKCSECDISFENVIAFKAHNNDFHCDVISGSKTSINLNKGKKFEQIKDKNNTSITSVYKNMNLDNELKTSTNGTLRCSFGYCLKYFKTKMRLISHLIEKHSWKGFRCTKCQFETFLFSNLREHESNVHQKLISDISEDHYFQSNCKLDTNHYKSCATHQSLQESKSEEKQTQQFIYNKRKFIDDIESDLPVIINTKRVKKESDTNSDLDIELIL